MLHVTAEEANVAGSGPCQRIIVGPDLGFNIHNIHVFTSGRDARSDRYHTHGDALKYYVQDSGFEEIADEKFEVKVGDFCHVPAYVWPGTINPNPEPLVFLAAQQFPGTYRQAATPFIRLDHPDKPPDVKDLSLEELGKLDPRLLYLRYIEEQLEFGKVALEMQRRREQKRLFLPAAEAPLMAWVPAAITSFLLSWGLISILSISLWSTSPRERSRHKLKPPETPSVTIWLGGVSR